MQITTPTFLEQLNPSQQKAVTHEAGPLLIIAGPGSGKTRTVVHSIAYAIENLGVMPDRILAFSFTVKASEELKHRVAEYVEQDKSGGVWISTFHHFCRQVLREDIKELGIGYSRNFKNLEENDQRKVVQTQINYLQYHRFAKRDDVLNFIAKCKAMDIRPSEAGNYAPDPNKSRIYVEIYERYEKHLKEEGAIDYENQQLFTDALFKKIPEVKAKWQDRFDLIFVDEYQDTDPVQYRIIKALAEKRQNLRVVGDDDQGIYGFRGADIQNILNFEKDYPDAKVITLEQNYRSTQQIVKASSAIADFNPDRREKELFTTNTEGEQVKHLHCANNEEEAFTIADFINRAIQKNWSFCDFAILYRTNPQAAAFKKAFADLGIPFNVVGESSDMPDNAVSIMTIHKSKGLEFPIVFVTGVCTDLLPHYFAKKEWDEELRLLYVAMTRAKNWLCLSSYDSDESQYQRGQSQFLDYIRSLLEFMDTLYHTPIPLKPEERVAPIAPKKPARYVESLPIQSDMTVIGVDSGTLNVGWSITQKSSGRYTVHDYNTEEPRGNLKERHKYIEDKINELVKSRPVNAIVVEKLDFFQEGAKDEWFLDVAGCVALIRSIADQHGIECHLYTPQHVKYVATGGDRNASKLEVQKAVKKMCNLKKIPQPDHSADAIAVSLCYLRNYLNSSRFQGNARKQEHCKGGDVHLDNEQYDAAVAEFKEAINIDPIFTDAHCSLGRAYLGQGNLKEAENAAKKALRLEDNYYLPARELLKAIKEAHCDCGNAYLSQGKLEAAEKSAKEALRFESNYPSALELLEQIKQAYYDRGLAYLNNEQYHEAIVQFKETISRYSNFTMAYCGLGYAYLGQGDLEAAENTAKKVLRLEGNDYLPARELLKTIKQTHCDRGAACLSQAKLDAAEKSIKNALRLDTSYQPAHRLLEQIKQAYYNQGLVHLNNKQYAEAIVQFNETINRYPDFIAAYCGLGYAYLGQGNLEAAENTAKKALRLEDNDYPPARELLKTIKQTHCDRGAAYLNQGQLEAAENAANAALRLENNYPSARELLERIKQAYYDRGLIHLNSEQYDKAITQFKEAIKIDSIFKEAYCGLGRAYFGQGNLKEAENAAKKVLEFNDSYQPVRKLLEKIKRVNYDRGRAYREQDNWIAPENVTEKVLALYNRGRAHCEQGNWIAAENVIKEAFKLDSSYQPVRKLLEKIKRVNYDRGRTHLNDEQYGAAVPYFKRAIDMCPIFTAAHCGLGRAYLGQGDLEKAKDVTKRALVLNSRYQPAHKLLEEIKQAYFNSGYVYLSNKQYNEAVSEFRKVINIDPDHKSAHYYLGKSYYWNGIFANAIYSCQTAITIDSSNKIVYLMLGLAYINRNCYA